MASSSDGADSSDQQGADFVWWTYRMVSSGAEHISWSSDGTRIVVSNPERMAATVLPNYFRKSQYSSWVRALNAYNFRKVGVGQWQHPEFQRGRPERLRYVTRKSRTPQQPPPPPAPSRPLSTALVRVPPHSVAALLAEERAKLWWMRSEVAKLEQQVQQMNAEDFQQRFDTVRAAQLMLSRLGIRTASDDHADPLRLTWADGQTRASPLALTDRRSAPNSADVMQLTLEDADAAAPAAAPGLNLGGGSSTAPAAQQLHGLEGFEGALSVTDDAATLPDVAPLTLLAPSSDVQSGAPAAAEMSQEQLRTLVNHYFSRLSLAADRALDASGTRPRWTQP